MDCERCAAAGGVGDTAGAVVRAGDRVDDREAKSAAPDGATRARSVEAAEDVFALRRRDAGAVVLHPEPGGTARIDRAPDLDGAAGGSVPGGQS